MAVRVLLVDDAADVRRLVRTALRLRGGFEIVGEAASGMQAVDLARRLQPDVAVLDLGLPDIAGEDVLTRLGVDSPHTKVVIFSGNQPADQAWFAARVAGYVLKDDELERLIDLLEAVGNRVGTEVTLDLPLELTSVARARRFLETTFADWGVTEDLAEQALIVVSELVTNALTHARSGCQVRLAMTESAVRIAVVDHGEGTPDPQPFSSTRSHGRGLHIVGALSTVWGVDRAPEGKMVWADMSRATSGP